MAGVQRQRFDFHAAGRRLHAEYLQPDRVQSGPILVFLHEGLGSIAQWKRFPARLCQACRLPGLVYERWGFGNAESLHGPRQVDYLHREAQILPEVLERCDVRERPVLIGHSDGGSIALLSAAAYPDRVRAVITEAAHVFVEEVTLAGIRAAKELYQTSDLRDRLARYHGDKVDSTFSGWCDTWLRSDFRDWNMAAELPSIVCPVLVMQGQDDEYGTSAQVEAIAAGVSGPVETCLVPDCGHVPHHQASEVVLRTMEQFIINLTRSLP
ncbi:MAG: alpha/beta hydrolase [Candidatus Competibacteraceae bacterium]